MFTDLRQAVRTLRKSPGFSALVVLVLAVGIGANTAIFSIVDGVLLKPLPFAHAERLVAVDTTLRDAASQNSPDATSYFDFVDWRGYTRTLDRLAAYSTTAATLTGSEGPALSAPITILTSDLLPMLGAKPALGRVFVADDDKKGAPRTVILSDALWASRFNRDPRIVGRAITVDADPFEVVGVMPPGFEFPIDAEDPTQMWVPIYASRFGASWADQRGAGFLSVLGLLKPGVRPEAAEAELAPLETDLAAKYGRSGVRSVAVHRLQDVLVKDYRLGLLVLFLAVGSVLLIACANVANLLLARGSVRRRELAVRAALGASRAQLVGQLIAESSVLSIAGGAGGAVIAFWTIDALVHFSPLQIPRLQTVHVDAAALGFTALVSIATGILSGTVPALQLSRPSADAALREGDRGGTAGGTRTRHLLVVAEMALSLVLLTSAGLLVRSLVGLQRVSPGFATDRAAAMQLLLPESRYTNAAAMRSFASKLHDELQALPGVSAVAISTTLPMSGSDIGVGFAVEGLPRDPKTRTVANLFAVSPDYFSTLRIPIASGRAFTARDDEHAPDVVAINETIAKRYWPNENPIGRHLTIGYNNTGPREIVAVVADVKQHALADAATPQIYAPYAQTPWPFVAAIVRTAGAPAAAIASLRAGLARVDPMQSAADVKTLDEYVERTIAAPRFMTVLVGAFAALALLLAGFGLFSVMAYSVAQRGREIGIRLALGAKPTDIRALVLGQAARIAVVGLAVGLAGALAATRIIESLLYGVTSHDPATFAGVSAALVAVMLAAAYLPARRAMRVDPIVSLRIS